MVDNSQRSPSHPSQPCHTNLISNARASRGTLFMGETCRLDSSYNWACTHHTGALPVFRCYWWSTGTSTPTGWQFCGSYIHRITCLSCLWSDWWPSHYPSERLGLITLFNGLDTIQSRDYIKVSCRSYIERICEKYLDGWGLSKHHMATWPTPLPQTDSFIKSFPLSATGDATESAQAKLSTSMGIKYPNVLGELIFTLITCRPDLSYAVVKCAQATTPNMKSTTMVSNTSWSTSTLLRMMASTFGASRNTTHNHNSLSQVSWAPQWIYYLPINRSTDTWCTRSPWLCWFRLGYMPLDLSIFDRCLPTSCGWYGCI